jgi:hypothetical protein
VGFFAAFGIDQKIPARFVVHLRPAGNFMQGAKAAQANIIIIERALPDAGRGYGVH